MAESSVFSDLSLSKKSSEPDISKLRLAVTNFRGFDEEGNSYYIFATPKSDYGILVCSKYGETLDAFYILKRDYPKVDVGGECAVAPNGDIYFLSYQDPNYVFYRLKRRW
jgi:hypothetical protein